LCFFFSSRRRHTRFSRDWSSDGVLFRSAPRPRWARLLRATGLGAPGGARHACGEEPPAWALEDLGLESSSLRHREPPRLVRSWQIGRAACRESAERWGVGGWGKKTGGAA